MVDLLKQDNQYLRYSCSNGSMAEALEKLDKRRAPLDSGCLYLPLMDPRREEAIRMINDELYRTRNR